jgi:hypothetical protein
VAGELQDQVIDQTVRLVHFRAGSLSASPLDGCTRSHVDLISTMLSGLAGALLGAGAAIWAQRRENSKARALELLRELERKLSLVRTTPTDPVQDEILSFYRAEGGSLSPGASAYLDYLTDLDFLLFAADRGFINLDDARYWLREHLRPDPDLKTFVTDLRSAARSSAAFEFLLRWQNQELARLPARA